MSTKSLLVVDDDPDLCELVKDVAIGQGFDVRTASRHEQFRRVYWSFKPSVIVLDLQMPGADGIELLRFLSADGCQSQILVVSGMDSRALAAANRLGAARGLRMLGAMEKPLDIERFESLLRRTTHDDETLTEGALEDAIEKENLVVYYQPKATLDPGSSWQIGEAEALVRWRHAQHGIIPPDLFIPLAEETGLIEPLTKFVVGSVATQMKEWDAAGMPVAVAVNLSPQSLQQLRFPDFLSNLLDGHGVDHRRVTVEITEKAAITGTAREIDVLTRFRVRDFGLSIDDFGTGCSSLLDLYRGPFNELKIDKSFVHDLNTSKESRIIVGAIVNLAHSLGLSVCAEGVEDAAALDLLREFGCEKFQGYFLSRPVPAMDFATLVRRAARR